MLYVPESFVGQCYNHFDRAIQLDILQEECAELIKAVSKVKRRPYNQECRANLIEEVSHVMMSIQVNALIQNIGQEEILKAVDKKADEYYFQKPWREEEI